MSRPKNPIPSYKQHPRDGTARCWYGGRWVYLGEYGSEESIAEYDRICAEARARAQADRAPCRPVKRATVGELLDAFRAFAEQHYQRRDPRVPGEVREYRAVSRLLRDKYGHRPVEDFGPVALQEVRLRMISAGWCRNRVNKQVGRVRRIFKWGVSQQLVPVAVVQSLACVEGLRRGKTTAPESARIKPITEAEFTAVLPHLVPTVRAMVELQWYAGFRPGEVRHLVAEDIDTAGDVWVYRPANHKTAWLDRDRASPLPERARTVLEPILKAASESGRVGYLFTPIQAREEMYAARRARRQSKVPPSQANRRKDYDDLQRKSRGLFTDDGYAAWIRRACKRAGVKPWHPNQLRHSFATMVRAKFGLEAAQVLLGHARADVTQVYAEKNWQLAVDVAKQL